QSLCPSDRAVPARRWNRCGRAYPHQPALRGLGPAVRHREQGGAGSNIGAEAAARSDPDGYTVLIGSLPLVVNRFIYPSPNYDTLTDFAPVTMICHFPNLLVVPNSSPAKSVSELIAHAKASNGNFTFASSGVGTSPHLPGELFKRMASFEMTHVPYRGAAPALNELIPRRVDMMFNTAGGVLQQTRAGQVRGLAVSTAKRFPTAMEFPSVAESGLPGFDVTSWYSFFLPAKTPPEIVRKLHDDTVAILTEPAIRARLEQVGVEVVASTPEQLAARIRAQMELWGPGIKAAGTRGGDPAGPPPPASDGCSLGRCRKPRRPRVRPSLAQPPREARGAVHARRRHRRNRPHPRRKALGDVGPASGGREQARRRRQHRLGIRRPLRPRRLHALHHGGRACGQPVPVPVDQLRPGRRLCAGDADLPVPQPPGSAEFLTRAFGQGPCRAGQSHPGQAHVREPWARQLAAHERRT